MKCNNRWVQTGLTEGHLGSWEGSSLKDTRHVYCLWILTVHNKAERGPDPFSVNSEEATRIITFTVERDLRVECGKVTISFSL